MPNLLAGEKSPYLLQHADNPVDWRPWGAEAFAQARQEDKPVLLSVGYATCHWCHVMAHESFEDQEVAQLMNRHFVAVKVDREERPDVDGVYMSVCQALTGAGGWPLTVLLTPDQKPFYAATYLPKNTRWGRPGLMELLTEVARLWREDRPRLLQTGEQITQALNQADAGSPAQLDEMVLEKAAVMLGRAFDRQWGGFGQAPKFPTPHQMGFLLRWHAQRPHSGALEMAARTLEGLRAGGIFDQVGLGFHRYSVDAKWLAPHFEKMLYDQALLALAYLDAFSVTGRASQAAVAREIFTYVLRDLTSPQGGFYSAEDADSEGEEGLYYLWTPEQVEGVLGPELAGRWNRLHDITPVGNFEQGRSIPWRGAQGPRELEPLDPALEEARLKLLAARQGRVHPLMDDKILTAWNGLMIAALARGARVLGEPAYLEAARRAAAMILAELSDPQGGLGRRWRQGQATLPGFLDDHAFFIWGLIELHQAGQDPAHLAEALRLTQVTKERFWDQEGAGYFYTPHQGEALILREKDSYDGAIPSGNAVMALNLLRLARLTGQAELETQAGEIFSALGGKVRENPAAHTFLLMALQYALAPGREIVVVGPREHPSTRALLEAAQKSWSPDTVVLLRPLDQEGERVAQLAPFSREMTPVGGTPAAYVCSGGTCQRPLSDPAQLEALLKGEAS